jgi:nucleotide-binding universal stress UspA family protein
VVVGSTGKGAVQRLLVGSTTDRLVHICRRPVLVVR